MSRTKERIILTYEMGDGDIFRALDGARLVEKLEADRSYVERIFHEERVQRSDRFVKPPPRPAPEADHDA